MASVVQLWQKPAQNDDLDVVVSMAPGSQFVGSLVLDCVRLLAQAVQTPTTQASVLDTPCEAWQPQPVEYAAATGY